MFPMPSDSSFRTAISCSVSAPFLPVGEFCSPPETTGTPCGNTDATEDSVLDVANWSELIAAESWPRVEYSGVITPRRS